MKRKMVKLNFSCECKVALESQPLMVDVRKRRFGIVPIKNPMITVL